MLAVRHRSASGPLDESWELEPREGRVRASVRQGNRIELVNVTVASMSRPRVGARPLVRVGEEAWRILPLTFIITSWVNGAPHFDTCGSPLGNLWPGDSLVLTNTPANVSALLETL